MRATATIGVFLLALGGCAGASPSASPVPAAAPEALQCQAWPAGGQPPSGARLAQSAEQSLPGTDSLRAARVPVMVGSACVVVPASNQVVELYCGAAEPAGAPRPCLVGEECAVGSIMVTDVTQFEDDAGVTTCATFENWSRTAARSIILWARTR